MALNFKRSLHLVATGVLWRTYEIIWRSPSGPWFRCSSMKIFGSCSAKLRGWFKVLWRPQMKRTANMQPWPERSLSGLIFTLRRCFWTRMIINKYSSSLQAEAFEIASVLLSEIFLNFFNFFVPTQQFFNIVSHTKLKFSATDFISRDENLKIKLITLLRTEPDQVDIKLITLLRTEPDQVDRDNGRNSVLSEETIVTFCYYSSEISNLGSNELMFHYRILEVVGTFYSPGILIIDDVILTCLA